MTKYKVDVLLGCKRWCAKLLEITINRFVEVCSHAAEKPVKFRTEISVDD